MTEIAPPTRPKRGRFWALAAQVLLIGATIALILAIWLPAIVGPSEEKKKRDERMDRGRAGSLRNR